MQVLAFISCQAIVRQILKPDSRSQRDATRHPVARRLPPAIAILAL